MTTKENKILSFFKTITLLDICTFVSLAVPLLLIIGRGYADGAMCFVSWMFLIVSFKNKDWRWIRTPWFLFTVVICVYMLFSGAMAEYNRNLALTSSFYWLRFPIFTITFITWILPTKKAQRYLLPYLSILLTLVSIDTIMQFATGTSLTGHPMPIMPGRLTGPFNRLLVGTFLTRLIWPTLGLCLMWVYRWDTHKKRLLFPVSLMALVGVTILISGERFAFALFGLSAITFLYFAKNLRRIFVPVAIITVLISTLLIIYTPSLQTRLIAKTLPELQNLESSPYGAVWHNGYIAWKSSPIFGIGLNNFVPMCEQRGASAGFRNELPEWKELHCVRHPHNPYLEWLSQLGIVGLVLFIILIGMWFKDIKQKFPSFENDIGRYYVQLGYTIGLIPFLWPFVASLSFFSNWSAILFWWVLGLALSHSYPNNMNSKSL